MAEFCLDCLNKISETNYPKSKFIISKDLDFCEECGEWTHVVIVERKWYYLRRLRLTVIGAKKKSLPRGSIFRQAFSFFLFFIRTFHVVFHMVFPQKILNSFICQA